jgi:ADP-heptose:LPS heptosyltransferase
MKGYKRTFTLPFKFDIPTYIIGFLDKSSLMSIYFKYLKRFIYIYIKRQSKLEISSISTSHKKILWINLSAPSLGDSLMDLSSRVLLKDRLVDLYTDKKNAHLYFNDDVFNNVYSQEDKLIKANYDLVILDSFSTRTIKVKFKLASSTLFVGMFGYFNGPEVNRVLFSFHRMNHLLGYIKSEKSINFLSRPSLSIAKKDIEVVSHSRLPKDYIAIAIGGEWNYRAFNNWHKIIRSLIDNDKNLKIVLVGSKNALRFSKELMEKTPSDNLMNCVDKFSFTQTAEIINQSQLLICCDGGLMHAANALKTPILAIFARLKPQMQLTDSIVSFSLFDNEDVNNINVSAILEEYSKFTNFAYNRLPFE